VLPKAPSPATAAVPSTTSVPTSVPTSAGRIASGKSGAGGGEGVSTGVAGEGSVVKELSDEGNKMMDISAPVDNGQVTTFITNALTLKTKGNAVFYNTLIQQLNKRDDVELLWRVYHGLASNITQFANDRQNRYPEVIHSVLSYDWRCDRRTTAAVVQLVTQMVSLNATFVTAAYDFFSRGFLAISHPTPEYQTQGMFMFSVQFLFKSKFN
jgi:hypothetical protein